MKPNILFIVADDLNAWLSCLGRNPDVKTPNIDRLAARGTLFSHTYCSAPYCNASRMSVFTGCLPATTGVYGNEPLWDVPDRRRTFIELLRENGYHTFGAGKVFHGVFDYAGAGRSGSPTAHWKERENRPFLWDNFHSNVAEPLPDDRPLNKFFDYSKFDDVPSKYHLFDWGPLPDDRVERMPDAAVSRVIRDFAAAPPSQPFFCAAGLYKPHLPWHVPQRFFDLYDPEKISLPVVKSDDLDDVPRIAKKWALSPRDHELVLKHNQWRPAVAAYLAAISYCDSVVGEILDAFEARGLLENTVVVLWGDNGFHLGEKLHWRKFVLWEEATRVPLIFTPPQHSTFRIHEPVSLVDIYPTLLDFAGIEIPNNLDGESLRPVIEGKTSRKSPAIMTWGRGNHSVRTKDWRLTCYSDGTEELYDHRVDAYEWTNLASQPEWSSVKESLRDWIPKTG